MPTRCRAQPNSIRGIAPPDGLVEGAVGTGAEAVKVAHVEEQECLFFVGLSRAKDRLFLYAPSKTTNGRRREPSPFLDRLGAAIVCRHVDPSLKLPVSETAQVSVAFESAIQITDDQLRLFLRCPRRFLYTHVLEIGGRRTETAFMKLHLAVQHVIDWVEANPTANPTEADIDARLTEAWEAHGPVEHGYAEEYRRIAGKMVNFYIRTRTGLMPFSNSRTAIGHRGRARLSSGRRYCPMRPAESS